MLRPLFEANFDKVNWANLSLNPSAIHLLVSSAQAEQRTEANPEEICWTYLSGNVPWLRNRIEKCAMVKESDREMVVFLGHRRCLFFSCQGIYVASEKGVVLWL
jgi:hypothetical protein